MSRYDNVKLIKSILFNTEGMDEWLNYVYAPDGAKKATIEEVEAFLLSIFKDYKIEKFDPKKGDRYTTSVMDERDIDQILFDEEVEEEERTAAKKQRKEMEEKYGEQPLDIKSTSIDATDIDEVRLLTNPADRPFMYQGKWYRSVEHAYQTLKGGPDSFDKEIFHLFHDADKEFKDGMGPVGGPWKSKIPPYKVDDWNLKLAEDLMVESFNQNEQLHPLIESTRGRELTHSVGDKFWKENFVKAFERARDRYTKSEDVKLQTGEIAYTEPLDQEGLAEQSLKQEFKSELGKLQPFFADRIDKKLIENRESNIVDEITRQLTNGGQVDGAGSGIYSAKEKGITQDVLDEEANRILKLVADKIRESGKAINGRWISGMQSGWDEAWVKAAYDELLPLAESPGVFIETHHEIDFAYLDENNIKVENREKSIARFGNRKIDHRESPDAGGHWWERTDSKGKETSLAIDAVFEKPEKGSASRRGAIGRTARAVAAGPGGAGAYYGFEVGPDGTIDENQRPWRITEVDEKGVPTKIENIKPDEDWYKEKIKGKSAKGKGGIEGYRGADISEGLPNPFSSNENAFTTRKSGEGVFRTGDEAETMRLWSEWIDNPPDKWSYIGVGATTGGGHTFTEEDIKFLKDERNKQLRTANTRSSDYFLKYFRTFNPKTDIEFVVDEDGTKYGTHVKEWIDRFEGLQGKVLPEPELPPVEVFEGNWKAGTPSLPEYKDTHVFIFGDNILEEGKGGQATIRGKDNIIGIPTKFAPVDGKAEYYFSDEILETGTGKTHTFTYKGTKHNYTSEQVLERLKGAFKQIEQARLDGKIIMMSKDGVGTGRSGPKIGKNDRISLEEYAPKFWNHLRNRLRQTVEYELPVKNEDALQKALGEQKAVPKSNLNLSSYDNTWWHNKFTEIANAPDVKAKQRILTKLTPDQKNMYKALLNEGQYDIKGDTIGLTPEEYEEMKKHPKDVADIEPVSEQPPTGKEPTETKKDTKKKTARKNVINQKGGRPTADDIPNIKPNQVPAKNHVFFEHNALGYWRLNEIDKNILFDDGQPINTSKLLNILRGKQTSIEVTAEGFEKMVDYTNQRSLPEGQQQKVETVKAGDIIHVKSPQMGLMDELKSLWVVVENIDEDLFADVVIDGVSEPWYESDAKLQEWAEKNGVTFEAAKNHFSEGRPGKKGRGSQTGPAKEVSRWRNAKNINIKVIHSTTNSAKANSAVKDILKKIDLRWVKDIDYGVDFQKNWQAGGLLGKFLSVSDPVSLGVAATLEAVTTKVPVAAEYTQYKYAELAHNWGFNPEKHDQIGELLVKIGKGSRAGLGTAMAALDYGEYAYGWAAEGVGNTFRRLGQSQIIGAEDLLKLGDAKIGEEIAEEALEKIGTRALGKKGITQAVTGGVASFLGTPGAKARITAASDAAMLGKRRTAPTGTVKAMKQYERWNFLYGLASGIILAAIESLGIIGRDTYGKESIKNALGDEYYEWAKDNPGIDVIGPWPLIDSLLEAEDDGVIAHGTTDLYLQWTNSKWIQTIYDFMGIRGAEEMEPINVLWQEKRIPDNWFSTLGVELGFNGKNNVMDFIGKLPLPQTGLMPAVERSPIVSGLEIPLEEFLWPKIKTAFSGEDEIEMTESEQYIDEMKLVQQAKAVEEETDFLNYSDSIDPTNSLQNLISHNKLSSLSPTLSASPLTEVPDA